MRRLAVIALLLAGGCLRANGNFHCTSDADCVRSGASGTCELVGFCSFADSSCPGGSRYGELSGDSSNQCVVPDVDAGVDAPPDVAIDAPLVAPPVYLNGIPAKTGALSTLLYSFTTPTGADSFLIVVVQEPSHCPVGLADPTVTGVTYNGAALTQIVPLLGTPCSGTITRTELWGLIAPTPGTFNVAVQLSGNAPYTLISGALVFANVDQTNPVRTIATATGHGVIASLDVASQPQDLVVSTVGQGGSIVAPGANQDLRYLLNIDSSNTLNNTAASTKLATDTTTTMTWTFGSADEWQLISTVLRPK